MRCVAPALLVGALLAGCETPEAASQAEDPPEEHAVRENPDGSIRVHVSATSDWVTVTEVSEGETLRFEATGEWGESPGVTRSADGGVAGMFGSGYWGVTPVHPEAPWGALVGRVGSQSFVVGQASLVEVNQRGLLQLSIRAFSIRV